MSSPSEPADAGAPSLQQDKNGTLNPIACVLAAGWILLPTIQYYATYQRTGLQLEGKADMPDLATLDLTPYYLILLAITVLFALIRREKRL